MLEKRFLIFSVFRAVYRSGGAAFFPPWRFCTIVVQWINQFPKSQGTASFCEGWVPLPCAVDRR